LDGAQNVVGILTRWDLHKGTRQWPAEGKGVLNGREGGQRGVAVTRRGRLNSDEQGALDYIDESERRNALAQKGLLNLRGVGEGVGKGKHV